MMGMSRNDGLLILFGVAREPMGSRYGPLAATYMGRGRK